MATPSVAMIPTGFKQGKLYSVLPENGSGDFDFTRASAATRVNEDGLIVLESIDSAELILNGTFENDDDWVNEQNTWTLGNGRAIGNGANGGAEELQQSVLTVGKTYKYSFEVENYVSGAIVLFGTGTAILGNGVYEGRYTAFTKKVSFRGVNFFGDITNVEVFQSEVEDIPRLDYTDGGCPVLLTEPQRTNEIPFSSEFSNASWIKTSVTVASDSTISPDGTVNASLITHDSTSSKHNIRRTISGSTDANISVFAKAKELRYVQIASANNVEQFANFDVKNGVVGNVGTDFSNAKIEDYGNGWFRCSVVSDSQYNTMYVSLITSLTSAWNESWLPLNSTDGLYLYGAQLEEGSYGTSYIPTNGSPYTRIGEVVKDAGDASTFNSTEGVLFAEIAVLPELGNKKITISDGSNNNVLNVQINASGRLDVNFVVGGAYQFILNYSNWVSADMNKIAVKYKENDFAVWLNGVEIFTDTVGIVPSSGTFDTLHLSTANSASDYLYGKTSQIQVFNTALSDSELQALTS